MIVLSLLACEGPVKPQAPQQPAPAPVAAAPAPAAPAAPAPLPPDTRRRANVLEVAATSKYSIFKMDACGAEAWVAGPLTKGVEVGQTVELPLGTPMVNFESKELQRTFDEILFVDKIEVAKEPLVCPPRHQQAGESKGVQADVAGVVQETLESGGYRYARLDVCGTETWVAGPKVPIKVGEVLLGAVSTEMKDFTSASLGRTFPRILFLKQITIGPTAPDCKGKAKSG